VIFMKPCRIMDCCYGKNALNFGLDPVLIVVEQQPIWILVIMYCLLLIFVNIC